MKKINIILMFFITFLMITLVSCEEDYFSTSNSIPTTATTSIPTSIPTSVPTSTPTSIPTSIPTSTPTSIPTSVPTSTPTSIPTSAPTNSKLEIPPLFNTPIVLPANGVRPTVEYNYDIPSAGPNISSAKYVSTTKELQTAVKSLEAGDELILKNGMYDGASITIPESAKGTKDKPIIIRADVTGGVYFKSSTSIKISGEYIILSGIVLQNGKPKDSIVIRVDGKHNRITNCVINGFDKTDTPETKTSYIQISTSAKYAEVDHCIIKNKFSLGVALIVQHSADEPDYAYIHDNYFGDIWNPGDYESPYDNGLECIRIGWSGNSQSPSYSVVENNIFDNISGDPELISVKSCNNVIRNNLIINCGSALTLRHGNHSLVENNVLIGNKVNRSNGIRVFDKWHVIRNNYVSGVKNTSNTSTNSGLVFHSGNNPVTEDNEKLTGQWTPNNCLVENNTLIENGVNLCIGDTKYDYAPENITFNNNLIYSEKTNAMRQFESCISKNLVFKDNYVYSNIGLGLISSTIPSGINYFNQIENASLKLNNYNLVESTLENIGAKGLKLVTIEEVSPSNQIQKSANKNTQYFENFFTNWPFGN